jgi:glutamate 5-kinase
LGSACITKEQGGLDNRKIKELAKDLIELLKNKVEVILVCSGAIQSAKAEFPLQSPSMSEQQALSAIGQNQVINAFSGHLKKESINVGQILLTHEDFKDHTRSFNLRNTMEKLLQWSCLPIVNENDSISFEEISLGDNDQLAAMITSNLEADLLLILSETDGLYDKNPSEKSAKAIKSIAFDEDFEEIQTISKSIAGRGGMKTKLEAVRKLTPLGIPVIIASYKRKSPLFTALMEDSCGSFFFASPQKAARKKAKIINQVRSSCSVIIDKGAKEALLQNKSLLPVGIQKLEGRFSRGDAIKIVHQRKIIGFGIAEYNSTDLRKYLNAGKPKNYIEKFGLASKVFIHKNNLVKKDH